MGESTPMRHIKVLETFGNKLFRLMDSNQPLGTRAGEYVKAKAGLFVVPEATPGCQSIREVLNKHGWQQQYESLLAQGYHPDNDHVLVYASERLIAMASWRTTKLIYRFDADFMRELMETPLSASPPAQVLERLPAHAFFVEFDKTRLPPALQSMLRIENFEDGVFVARSGDDLILAATGVTALRVSLTGDVDVAAAIDDALDKTRQYSLGAIQAEGGSLTERVKLEARLAASRENLNHFWSAMMNALLYLCSDKPDLDEVAIPKPKRQQFGTQWRTTIAKTEKTSQVGVRIGAIFRHARAALERTPIVGNPSGAAAVPHIRRAHWHTYWTGPRTNPEPILKWLSPILVNASTPDELTDTIHPVERERMR